MNADHGPSRRVALADPVSAVRRTTVRRLDRVRPETAVSRLDRRRDAAIPGHPAWAGRFGASLNPPER